MYTIKEDKLLSFIPDDHNANRGTRRGSEALNDSLVKYKAGRSLLVDKNGKIISGNKTYEQARKIGMDDVIIVQTNGEQIVAVQRLDLDLDTDKDARELAYADNRIAELDLDWDARILLDDTSGNIDLGGLFDKGEIDKILKADNLGVPKDSKPNPRKLSLDIIYTVQGADATCCLAIRAGWKYGVQSPRSSICPYCERGDENHKVVFIDNDYFQYNHLSHLEMVKQYRPKYCTVRDIMDKPQCMASGIEYYSFEQIIDWAEELQQYAENVIVIPKYDCLDDIPEKFMLGYSVPTSHGGTPLPVNSFKGRRVHLLGGSWKQQLAHMAVLGDDVVSLDNNYVARNATELGVSVDPEGNEYSLKEKLLGDFVNPRYVGLALSFGAIAFKVNELYPVRLQNE